MLQWWQLWQVQIVHGTTLLLYMIGVLAACHALLTKRDPRSAFGWIVTCVGFPGFGALAYLLFGINRIQLRARSWRALAPSQHRFLQLKNDILQHLIARHLPFDVTAFQSLLMISNAVTQQPLVGGCNVTPLYNGDETYPRMLAAIANAKHSIYLSTYIFDRDTTGTAFAHALKAAADRGVEVRVLIDGVGNLYSWPTQYRLLKKLGINVALFLPFSLSSRAVHFNLRNHRKILAIDDEVGFTGGMNIGDRHLANRPDNPRRVCDIHFEVTGPIVRQLRQVFLIDWMFARGPKAQLTPSKPSAELRLHPSDEQALIAEYDAILHHFQEEPPSEKDKKHIKNNALCRGLVAGPNEDLEKLRWIVLGAFASARRNVRIMTPYFIPDAAFVSAINTAVLRGVNVEIILPQTNNLPFVHWASQGLLWELLQYNVPIYYQPGVFVHSKYLIVDDFFSLIGSANLDPRSLRLNFEFNVEVYDKALAATLSEHFDAVKVNSHRVTLQELDARPLPVKFRDAFAKLFSPYL